MQENTHSVSDDEPIFSKNEIREIRIAMAQLINENEELRSKIIAMDAMVKKREATLKKANMYISQLEYTLAKYSNPNINLN